MLLRTAGECVLYNDGRSVQRSQSRPHERVSESRWRGKLQLSTAGSSRWSESLDRLPNAGAVAAPAPVPLLSDSSICVISPFSRQLLSYPLWFNCNPPVAGVLGRLIYGRIGGAYEEGPPAHTITMTDTSEPAAE